ncbi:MAG TPA: hypothetical protein VG477_04080 [Thermoanaerobaculia bacterium]|nr:hypothetical protein [Thermoanaerobaculia bacterium]
MLKIQRPLLAAFVLALALAPATLLAHAPDAPSLATVALFNPAALETPESIVITRNGDRYISLAFTGEIRKITADGSQSTLAVIPIGPPLTVCGPFFNGLTGITLDPRTERSLYASAAACDPAFRGVWRVPLDGGAPEVVATLPLEAIPNGIAFRHDRLYVADSNLGVIWRVPAEGGTAEVWLEDPSLAGVITPELPLPGANGLQIFRNEVYVANSGQGTVLAISFGPGDTAGEIRVHAVMPPGTGGDDFAFDVHGNIYMTTDPANVLVKIAPDGSTEILLTAADGLDGPTAAAFGRTGADRFNLYITNAAFPFFTTTFRPSLMRLHLDVPGAPPNW